MSRGAGNIERQLIKIFEKNKKSIFSTTKLCCRVFRLKVDEVEKKHRVSVLRALKRLSNRSTKDVWRAVYKGERDDFWFNNDLANPKQKLRRSVAPAGAARPRKT